MKKKVKRLEKIRKDENRSLSIDLLRILAIVLIIGFHFFYEFTLNNDLRKIGFVGVSLFFIISGYTLAKRHPKLEKFSLKWLFKRYLKIASVYYLAIIIIVVLFGKQTYSGSLWDIFLHLIFLDPLSKTAAYTIISPAWFITPLIGLYIFYPYLNKYIKKEFSFLIIAFFIMTVMRTLNPSYTSYSPLFFIGEFCFGIAVAHGKKYPPLVISLITVFIDPIMFLPYIIFILFYNLKFEYLPNKLIHFIGINTFLLFLYHEAFIKVGFSKWHIYNLGIIESYIILIILIILSSFITKRIQDYFFNHKIFSGPIYDKEF